MIPDTMTQNHEFAKRTDAADVESVLEVQNLHTQFHTDEGTVQAVDGVDFNINSGEIVGLVGESGSGKTVTAKSILRLIKNPGEITAGKVYFDGKDILDANDSTLRAVRGDNIAMIFQNTNTALNPTETVGKQLRRILIENTEYEPTKTGLLDYLFGQEEYPRDELDERIDELFAEVSIAGGLDRFNEYPHEFSGGMVQRTMIAMVLGCEPDLIIADEPTTNLDVTIEAQILKLLWDLSQELSTSILFITHDLGVVSELCDRIMVMYAGRIVEKASVEDLFADPKHPYTQALLESIPRLDEERGQLQEIEGSIPNPTEMPTGCRFAPRCPEAMEECQEVDPGMRTVGTSETACHLYEVQQEEEESR